MNCLAVMCYVLDKGVKHELKVTMPHQDTRTDEFMAKFPDHHVPAITDGDLNLTEQTSIIRYLANKHHFLEGLGAYPASSAADRAAVDRIMDWRISTFYDAAHKVIYPAFQYLPMPSAEQHAAEMEAFTEVLSVTEKLLGGKPMFGGSTPNCADYSYYFFFKALTQGAVPDFTVPAVVTNFVAAFEAASPSCTNAELVGYFYSLCEGSKYKSA